MQFYHYCVIILAAGNEFRIRRFVIPVNMNYTVNAKPPFVHKMEGGNLVLEFNATMQIVDFVTINILEARCIQALCRLLANRSIL